MNDSLALEVRNITKRFPGVLANDHVNFDPQRRDHACSARTAPAKHSMNIIYGLAPQTGDF
jgi:ABC-type uncharacterized transport system ATPase subunit